MKCLKSIFGIVLLTATIHAAGQSPILRATDKYNAKKETIDQNDPGQIAVLVEWAVKKYGNNQETMKLAQTDLLRALDLKKRKKDTDTLAIESLMKMVEARLKPEDKTDPVDKPKTQIPSERDIHWMRLMELRSTDRVRVIFKNDAVNRYIESMRGRDADNWDNPAKETQFKSLPGAGKAVEMLCRQKENAELLKDILVQQDPQFMVEFRKQIWPIIVKGCAASNCHGTSLKKPALKYVIGQATSEACYANFAILSGYTSKGGARLIDRQDPKKSLLLQHGLDPKYSQVKHGGERVINPIFKSPTDPKYKMVLAWISSLKGPFHPDYRMKQYKPFGLELKLEREKVDIPLD